MREELDRRIHTLVALRDELDGCIVAVAVYRAATVRFAKSVRQVWRTPTVPGC